MLALLAPSSERPDTAGPDSACQQACASPLARLQRGRSCEGICGRFLESIGDDCAPWAEALVRCAGPRLVTSLERQRGEGSADRVDRSGTLCPAEYHALRACRHRCAVAGTLVSGSRPVPVRNRMVMAAFEATANGCGPCAARPGAGPLAPCTSPRICAEICCACSTIGTQQRVRACIDGRCAEPHAACGLFATPAELGACAP